MCAWRKHEPTGMECLHKLHSRQALRSNLLYLNSSKNSSYSETQQHKNKLDLSKIQTCRVSIYAQVSYRSRIHLCDIIIEHIGLQVAPAPETNWQLTIRHTLQPGIFVAGSWLGHWNAKSYTLGRAKPKQHGAVVHEHSCSAVRGRQESIKQSCNECTHNCGQALRLFIWVPMLSPAEMVNYITSLFI